MYNADSAYSVPFICRASVCIQIWSWLYVTATLTVSLQEQRDDGERRQSSYRRRVQENLDWSILEGDNVTQMSSQSLGSNAKSLFFYSSEMQTNKSEPRRLRRRLGSDETCLTIKPKLKYCPCVNLLRSSTSVCRHSGRGEQKRHMRDVQKQLVVSRW